MQRSSATLQSAVDQREAYLVGQTAVQAMARGVGGQMVTLERLPGPNYACRVGFADLSQVAGMERLLPDGFIASGGHDVTPEFLSYVRPLIGGPLPAFAVLAHVPVERQLPLWEKAPG